MLKKIIIIIIALISCFVATAQARFVLSGTVSDAVTGEDLVGATVYVEDDRGTGAVTNSYGFYSLTLSAGTYRVHYRYVGYGSQELEVVMDTAVHQAVELTPVAYELGNIEVSGGRPDRNVTSTEMGLLEITPGQLEHIPVIFGEADLLKTIQLMPGVKAAGEGNSGFHVRGGGLDQNLLLLDEAPVYGASHLLGFFSVFNTGAIRHARLLKGSIPAGYGGRTSSVLDIRMREGNLRRFGVSGNLGLISSSLTLEGPLVKDKSSFILSGRRTYADLFLKLSGDADLRRTYLYFYDLNLKTNYKLNSRNRIFLSGYLGRDDFGYKDEYGFDWGSLTGTLRWNHIFSDRLFSNTSLIHSNYSYHIAIAENLGVSVRSRIKDLNLKQDFTYYVHPAHTLQFGLNLIHHTILPGDVSVEGAVGFFPSGDIPGRKALEWAAYLSNEQRIAPFLTLSYGLRLAMFSNLGGEYYTFDTAGELLTVDEAGSLEIYKTQGGIEPRLALTCMLTPRSSVKASYNRLQQFLHLLSNTTTSTPVDLWIPSSNQVKPQVSDQVSVGYFRNFRDHQWESSLEVYYKNQQNQIDYKNGAELVFNSMVESELVFGRGWAYGAELLVKRNSGRLNGWAGYTLSRTLRQFSAINQGRSFPARHDRVHDITIVALYDLSPRVKVSATWVYNTGNAVTFPGGKYEIEGQPVAWYTERNGYRMPDYHRLDAGITWQRKKTATRESSWSFSVYNVYGRENAYFIDFRSREDDPRKTEAVQVSLFSVIPSVSYRFKF
ncbi:MAG: TonB-dependent receptor [Mariniphaga sp.]